LIGGLQNALCQPPWNRIARSPPALNVASRLFRAGQIQDCAAQQRDDFGLTLPQTAGASSLSLTGADLNKVFCS
jgi:hypothetical protein